VYISKLFTYRKFHRCMHQEMMLSKRESIQQTIVNVIYPNSLIIRGIIEAGIKKGSFRKVDPPLVIATLVGTINQVLLSKKMCNKLLGKNDDYIPYNDKKFISRVSTHLKALMHTYLVKIK
jgi:Tetracyclin repressor-like, C-terminal domain